MHTPPQYTRQNKDWADLIGQEGTVIAVTTIRVGSPEHQDSTPYDYAIIEFADCRREMMVAGHQRVVAGDRVVCQLRKLAKPDESGIIPYGVKVVKVESQKKQL
jgi:uncharacterized OB-fold protein